MAVGLALMERLEASYLAHSWILRIPHCLNTTELVLVGSISETRLQSF